MKKVLKITPDMDPREVLCTTYQMRNCFRQFADGVASELDVHCYFQHAYAADLCKPTDHVLDVCCGRGLLIPFLRYRGGCAGYVGVDIHPKNATWQHGKDPRRPSDTKTDWGFPRTFIESNVDDMAGPIAERGLALFDVIVFTSAIEHMQPASQKKALKECHQVASPKGLLYLTYPETLANVNGYDVQFAAHVYEPSRKELESWLHEAGWKIKRRIGLSSNCTRFRALLTGKDLAGAEYLYKIMPREQALCTIGAMYPKAAAEVAYVCAAQ